MDYLLMKFEFKFISHQHHIKMTNDVIHGESMRRELYVLRISHMNIDDIVRLNIK